MSNILTYLPVTTIVALVAALSGAVGSINPAPSEKPDSVNSLVADRDTLSYAVRLVTAPNGNTARYLVREQLAGFDFPNDAVGETDDVRGVIVFDDNGDVIPEESGYIVDITGLTSDSSRRDGFIQRNTLEGEIYPTVELTPIQTRGLTFPFPEYGTETFDIIANLKVRDVTILTSWRVTAMFEGGTMTGTARTEFTFDEIGLEKPSVGSVLSVADAIRLELDFTLDIESLASR